MNTLRVLYDEGGFYETHGGVSRYFTEVMKRLATYGVEYRLSVKSTNNSYLREPPFSLPPHPQSVQDFINKYCGGRRFPGVGHLHRALARMMPWAFPSGDVLNYKSLDRMLREGDFDIYHPTHPHVIRNVFRKVVGRKPIVVTIHDLIPELFVGGALDVQPSPNRAEILRAASKVIAVSENTKRDLMRIYGTPEEKIRVIYHGYLPSKAGAVIDEQLKEQLSEPYVLFVGKRSGYKNFAWMVRTLAPMLREGLKLVCTGAPFDAGEQELLTGLGVAERVSQRFFSDVELNYAYSKAVAFIYPSRYEGFGIPILDAFSAGCPVILSRTSCFPEVAGDAALYFDEGDEAALKKAVGILTPGGDVRAALIEKGRERVKRFSWDKCAEETARVYQSVC